MNYTDIPIVPLLLAVALAGHGLRKKSLSPSGALAAFVIGFAMMSTRVRAFGVSLIVFYLVGSRATKAGKTLKASLEEGHQEAGYRTAWQVLCNSFTAFLASLLWTGLFTKDSFVSALFPQAIASWGEQYVSDDWCPTSALHGSGWSRWLLFATLGHFACCLGDTLASELGILSKSPPLLITTFTRVPPGTNGGVSFLGTAASAAGGLIMGLTMAITLVFESSACKDDWLSLLRDLSAVGACAGFFGSLVDSFMGATVQRTRYSNTTKRILQDDTIVSDTKDVKVVSGLNILTNNQVNLLSSIITAFATASLA